MKTRGLYLLPLLIVIMGFIVLPVEPAQASDYPPPGATITIDWWTYYKDDPSLESYYKLRLKWTDSEGTHTITVPAWCVDSNVYGLAPTVVVVPSWDEDDIPNYAKDDEEWDKINYLMVQWQSKSDQIYKDCSWKDIQQAIWVFGDAGYNINSQVPKGDPDNIDDIIADVNASGDGYSGDCPVVICLGGISKQITFFTIPEVPLGTITSLGTMIGAFIVNERRKRS